MVHEIDPNSIYQNIGVTPVINAAGPITEGMRNEIIIHNIHRFPYDQCYTAVGAKLVGVGDFLRCLPWELEAAINENTAAIAYLDAPFVSRNAMPLKEVVEIAHKHKLPVIVDAATMIPPRSNFTKLARKR